MNMPQTVYLDRKLVEKVDDCWCPWMQRRPEDERRQHDARGFRRELNRFHREKLCRIAYGLSWSVVVPPFF